MVNLVKYKLVGGNIYLKEHVVPHIFQCKTGRKRPSEEKEFEASAKKARQNIVESLLMDNASENITDENVLRKNTFEKCTQTQVTEVKNFGAQVLIRPYYRSKLIQTEELYFKPQAVSVACSPFKFEISEERISPSNFYQ
ncbi:unnamed protein product [Psylliodes chrysocephalus]|uniref:Uncharacterized protein n=1 Tax=Psylliodes chrysocephalus TaxID=3402493 RepID=A0A9P0GM51_9CUCU|nr:unnamed protein product [Psylliodes chrysocephala]